MEATKGGINMNNNMKESLYSIIEYALNTIKYYNRDDEHWMITASLLRHEFVKFKKAQDEEE